MYLPMKSNRFGSLTLNTWGNMKKNCLKPFICGAEAGPKGSGPGKGGRMPANTGRYVPDNFAQVPNKR